MTPEQLTDLAQVHSAAISHQQTTLTRHDQEMAEFRAALQESSAQHDREMAEIRAMQRSNQEQLALNQEQLALLTAGLVELRNLVADYLQGRSQRAPVRESQL